MPTVERRSEAHISAVPTTRFHRCPRPHGLKRTNDHQRRIHIRIPKAERTVRKCHIRNLVLLDTRHKMLVHQIAAASGRVESNKMRTMGMAVLLTVKRQAFAYQ